MSISIPTETVYRTCYHIDLAAGTATLGKYNYTEMLEKMASASERDDVTYWVPDEYGRVLVDPKHPYRATLEYENASNALFPASALYSLPSCKKEKTEEEKLQEERTRLFREELERLARQEALLHRVAQSMLAAHG